MNYISGLLNQFNQNNMIMKKDGKNYYKYSMEQQCFNGIQQKQIREYQWLKNLNNKNNLIKNEFG